MLKKTYDWLKKAGILGISGETAYGLSGSRLHLTSADGLELPEDYTNNGVRVANILESVARKPLVTLYVDARLLRDAIEPMKSRNKPHLIRISITGDDRPIVITDETYQAIIMPTRVTDHPHWYTIILDAPQEQGDENG